MIRNKKAFTLIELIVTMAVLAILVLIGAPRFGGQIQDAQLTRGIANSKSIEQASERYFMDHDDWPRLSDVPYTSEELEEFSERVYNATGKEVVLDPEGNYYDIDYDKLSEYVTVNDDKRNYILQNPVGKVYYMEGLSEKGFSRVDYNLGLPIIKIENGNNGNYINTNTPISFSHSQEDLAIDEQWKLNNEILENKPSGIFSAGDYKVQVRVLYENERWSDWSSVKFSVTQHREIVANNTNSNIINNFEYGLGDSLVFNPANNLNWIVSADGTYKFEVLGASGQDGQSTKSKGGKGAKITGEIELNSGDNVNLIIYRKGFGGGGQHYSSRVAGRGGGGTIIHRNESKVIAAGGGGGAGFGVGRHGLYNRYDGAGGSGGHGGMIGQPGERGEDGTGNWGSGIRRAGAGGSSPSAGGQVGANTWSGIINFNGENGGLHNGGGGGPSGQGGGGGGGAGGSSFLHGSLVNPVVTTGYNSGNGKVIITFIGEIE